MRRKCNSTQVILLILVAVFTVLNPNFLSPFNLYNFLMQNEYRIVMITGLAIIMRVERSICLWGTRYRWWEF